MNTGHKLFIIATQNQGKLNEFKTYFNEFGIVVRSLADYTDLPDIIEDGQSFAENALIKAKLIAEHLRLPVLADDSGLCVDALDGRPGVYSARYAGEQATDEMNNEKLLAELNEIRAQSYEGNRRSLHKVGDIAEHDVLSLAQFVCALVLYYPDSGQAIQVEGACPGYITSTPRGGHGFGYDPLFVIPEYNQTLAELSPQLKNEVSHRGHAIRKLLVELRHTLTK